MSVVVESVPNRHAMLVTFTDKFDAEHDLPLLDKLTDEVKAQMPDDKTIYHLLDLTYAQNLDLGRVLTLLKAEQNIRNSHLAEYTIIPMLIAGSPAMLAIVEHAVNTLLLRNMQVVLHIRQAYTYIDAFHASA